MTDGQGSQAYSESDVGTRHESRPFRSRSPQSHPDRLAIMRLEFEIPRDVWLSAFSRAHPDLLIEVHNTMTVAPKQTLGDFEIYGPRRDWTNEVAGYPDVLDVERLEVFPDLGRYRVRFLQPIFLSLAHALSLLLSYPMTTQAGVYSCETVAQTQQVRGLITALRDAGCKARVVSLRRDSLRSCRPAFTPVQRDVFRQALASGYFEVPRRITLTGLATKLSRSKSSVSETLAVVERKLAETAASAAM
jgi:HTH DNA binding domain